MPKTVAPISHDAIKRSLKSKFKLILSENRILIETINGYVRKAEKVYKEMESTADVTPKQFAKAMEKLERAYSACVRLIMVASDLFEKGDSDETKIAESSCESETSACSSESSATITDSNRARKIPNEKFHQRRSKSSDVKANGAPKTKVRTHSTKQKSATIELAEIPTAEPFTGPSERLFVRSGSSSDCDHLIELQRFLHGLEKEKLQTDHPSPCVAPEKQLVSCKSEIDEMSSLNQCQTEAKSESPQESVSQCFTHRLKMLKSAIEHFKDRSLGDERVTQALNDIRELVLKCNDPMGRIKAHEGMPEEEHKRHTSSQMSLLSESNSVETHPEIEDKVCQKEAAYIGEGEDLFEIEQKHSLPLRNNRSESPFIMQQVKFLDRLDIPQRSPIANELQETDSNHQTMMDNNEQIPQGEEQTPVSPQSHPHVPDDINHIIVNKIVDMVSARLAPRLLLKNNEDQRGLNEMRAGQTLENTGLEESTKLPKRVPRFSCQETPFSNSPHIVNYCGNYNHLPQLHRQKYQQHHGQQQQQHNELQKLQRRHQRPKVVSFMEDYETDSECKNAWRSGTFSRDSSPLHVSSSLMYNEFGSDQPHNYKNQPCIGNSSPHKKRSQAIEIHPHVQRYNEKLQLQQHYLSLCRKQQENEDIDTIQIDIDTENDDEASQSNESDSEMVTEQQQYLPQDIHCKSTASYDSLSWTSRPAPMKSPSVEADYKNLDKIQRGQLPCQQSQTLHKNDSIATRLPPRSPSPDNCLTYPTNHREKEWFSTPQQPAEPSSLDGCKARPNEGDGKKRLVYHFEDKLSSEAWQDDDPDWEINSPENHGEWAHNPNSPKSPGTHPQQHTQPVRQLPAKIPRSVKALSQPQHPSGIYNNYGGNQSGLSVLRNNDVINHNSESSCEPSPMMSTDEQLHPDNISSCNEDPGCVDQTTPQPEMVCIDGVQIQADASRTIILSNLPLDLDETELLNIFKTYGQVTKIYYIKDRITGLFQGRAYGKFSKASEAYDAAQNLHKFVIEGNEICVQLYVNTE